jgi:hypothetical protein
MHAYTHTHTHTHTHTRTHTHAHTHTHIHTRSHTHTHTWGTHSRTQATCVMDSTGRDSSTRFGIETSDEMCWVTAGFFPGSNHALTRARAHAPPSARLYSDLRPDSRSASCCQPTCRQSRQSQLAVGTSLSRRFGRRHQRTRLPRAKVGRFARAGRARVGAARHAPAHRRQRVHRHDRP